MSIPQRENGILVRLEVFKSAVFTPPPAIQSSTLFRKSTVIERLIEGSRFNYNPVP